MLRKILLLAGIIFTANAVKAQLGKNLDQASILYEKEVNGGVMLHSGGFGMVTQFSKYKTATRYSLIDLSAFLQKHPKEISLNNPDYENSRPYIFGKEYALFILSAGYGNRHILADKFLQNDVRVNFNYSGGPVLGLLKPVYYEVDWPGSGSENDASYERFNPADEAQHSYIMGKGPAYKGLNQMGGIVGVNGKMSFSFEWGRGNNDFRFYSLESGISVNVFPKEVPIFAYIKNQKAFINLFLCLTLGSRH